MSMEGTKRALRPMLAEMHKSEDKEKWEVADRIEKMLEMAEMGVCPNCKRRARLEVEGRMDCADDYHGLRERLGR